MQESYPQIGAPANAPASVTNHGITSFAEAHVRLAAYLRQRRVQQLIDHVRAQERLRRAMQAWRTLVQRPSRAAVASPTLHALLHQAAVWLRAHPQHPDALAVAMHLERIAPGWRQGQLIIRKVGQGGA